jgi:hypothetical protein
MRDSQIRQLGGKTKSISGPVRLLMMEKSLENIIVHMIMRPDTADYNLFEDGFKGFYQSLILFFSSDGHPEMIRQSVIFHKSRNESPFDQRLEYRGRRPAEIHENKIRL